MRILALERDLGENGEPVEISRDLARAEAARVWELYQAGTIREMYFRDDAPLATLIMECDSVDHAARAIESLPLVKAGAIAFEIIPLRAYPGFARLFGEAE